MRYYVQNVAGDKFFFAHLEEGEIPVSSLGKSLGPIEEVNKSDFFCPAVVILGRSYQVFTV